MKRKITLVLSAEAGRRLDALIAKTGADGAAAVFADALRLYEALVDEDEAGTRWLRKPASGDPEPFDFFVTSDDDRPPVTDAHDKDKAYGRKTEPDGTPAVR